MTIIYNLMKTAVGLFCLCLYTLGLADNYAVYHFNFGRQLIAIPPDCKTITPDQKFNENNSEGFISGNLTIIEEDRSYTKSDTRLYDGVQSDSAIEFRFKLPAGRYCVELLMQGGKYTRWIGKISLNNSVIADTLYPFRTSAEGEAAPAYWALIKRISVDKDYLFVRVAAKKQKSTLCGLSIYPDSSGPLHLDRGKIVSQGEFLVPNLNLILKLINSGRPEEAERLIYALPDEFRLDKAYLLIALAGRLEVSEPRAILEWAATLLHEELTVNNSSQAALNLKLIESYITADRYYKMAGWDWAKKYTREGIFSRLDLSGMALNEILEFPEHPLYHRALWMMGKLNFWAWIEQHGPRQIKIARESFDQLAVYYPDHRLLKMYRGKQIPFDTEYKYNNRDPLWAQKAHHALKNILEIIHYWVEFRQAENGEFGGKFDDDVEMLRWWPVASLVAGDSTTKVGLIRLVNGMWNSGWLEKGFSKRILDVEHSSEPVADTQPMMIGIDYGNPVYVERCMESIRGLDFWTGINDRGHRHFKSSWYSATEIDERPPKDCDVPYNTRTVKAARWLAWYNRHPVAMKFLKEWGDAWLEDCLRIDKGKPYGIVPSAIRYHDDAIGGHADNWYYPGLFWSYYNFHGGIDMLKQFLSNYLLFKDSRYLQPVELAIQLAQKYRGIELSTAIAGSEEWTANIFNNSVEFANLLEQWRLITGNKQFDEFLLKAGSEYLKFRLTGDKNYLIKGCEYTIEATSYNRELMTTEAYFTDRVDIKNIREESNQGVKHLESMYTGKALLNCFYPFSDVVWRDMGSDFAAIVLESGSQFIRILTYNLKEVPVSGNMYFWNLDPGEYLLTQGIDENSDGMLDRILEEWKFTVSGHIGTSSIILPGRELCLIEIKSVGKRKDIDQANLPDLAISQSDFRVVKTQRNYEITIPVHNIGIASAENFNIQLLGGAVADKRVIRSKIAKILEAPLDLIPRIEEVTFNIPEQEIPDAKVTVMVNPEKVVPEITTVNNMVSFDLNDLVSP